jgi:hypothetical protein
MLRIPAGGGEDVYVPTEALGQVLAGADRRPHDAEVDVMWDMQTNPAVYTGCDDHVLL